MSEQCLGIVVSGTKANFVHLQCDTGEDILIDQFTWSLQSGEKADAYVRFLERIKNYISEKRIMSVYIKASAVGREKAKLSHLHSAELRGIVCVAAKMAGAEVTFVQKAAISRTFGERKADEYINDDSFWVDRISGTIPKIRREAALLIISRRNN